MKPIRSAPEILGLVARNLLTLAVLRTVTRRARDAIEVVMTLDPWRILMCRLSPLLALLFVTPALAETLDCAVIKSTTHPFELTFDWTMTAKGRDPLAVQMRQQVTRKADETIVYEFFAPGKFVRRTLNGAGFRLQIRTAGETAAVSRVSTYSIDVTKDYFGLGKPFDFNEVVKGADGTVVSDVNTSVSFEGAVNVEVGGCAYTLTKIIELSHGSVRGIAGSNRAEIWYSRDLKTALYTRNDDGSGSIMEMRARDISTSFTPVE
jgi:hypothetical protein